MMQYYYQTQVTISVILLQNLFKLSSSVSPGFGYHCTRQGSKLTFDDARQTCHSIPSDGDLDQYEFGRISCRRYGFGQSNGPCDKDKIFVERPKSSCGICMCDDNRGSRPFLRQQLSNHCAYIYDQGSCRTGEWLVLDRPSRQLVCEENPCLKEDGDTAKDQILFNGRCVNVYSRQRECERFKVVGFVYGNPVPTCIGPGNTQDYGIVSISESAIQCGGGKFRSLSGRCQPSWVW